MTTGFNLAYQAEHQARNRQSELYFSQEKRQRIGKADSRRLQKVNSMLCNSDSLTRKLRSVASDKMRM